MRPDGKNQVDPCGPSRCLPCSVAVAGGFEPTKGVNPHTLSRSADGRSGAAACNSTCTVTRLAGVYGRSQTEANETTTETGEDHPGDRLLIHLVWINGRARTVHQWVTVR
jgi:hypothetical protein